MRAATEEAVAAVDAAVVVAAINISLANLHFSFLHFNLAALANNYFQFKQFTVHQENCAMKVCTDACILGAYTAQMINSSNANILDIGTGTGILSLMLAQKTTGYIDAIEMDTAAAAQATENVQRSPWAERINVINNAVQQFHTSKKYDLIISNPPFFENDLKSNSEEKNNAKHDTALTLQELIAAIKNHLSGVGSASVLLPYHRTTFFTEAANDAGLFANNLLLIKQSPKHSFFRSVILMSSKKTDCVENQLIIHNELREYSPLFISLLKDYYLKL